MNSSGGGHHRGRGNDRLLKVSFQQRDPSRHIGTYESAFDMGFLCPRCPHRTGIATLGFIWRHNGLGLGEIPLFKPLQRIPYGNLITYETYNQAAWFGCRLFSFTPVVLPIHFRRCAWVCYPWGCLPPVGDLLAFLDGMLRRRTSCGRTSFVWAALSLMLPGAVLVIKSLPTTVLRDAIFFTRLLIGCSLFAFSAGCRCPSDRSSWRQHFQALAAWPRVPTRQAISRNVFPSWTAPGGHISRGHGTLKILMRIPGVFEDPRLPGSAPPDSLGFIRLGSIIQKLCRCIYSLGIAHGPGIVRVEL
jgi:hypothetical protein